MTTLDEAVARALARYALHVYLPLSGLARVPRAASRRLRGKPPGLPTRLAKTDWGAVVPAGPVRLVEPKQRFGNVRLSELAILALAAARVPAGSTVVTLDLPSGLATAFPVEADERALIDKPRSGARLRDCRGVWHPDAGRVVELFGDSATFDWSPYHGRAGLVFVDGSHAYDYAVKDSDTALRLVRAGGLVLWHDYGVWPGVTRSLERLEAERGLGLRHIRNTSLVAWRAPRSARAATDAAPGQGRGDELHLAPTNTPAGADGPPTRVLQSRGLTA